MDNHFMLCHFSLKGSQIKLMACIDAGDETFVLICMQEVSDCFRLTPIEY
jgi:hypothetical protein